MREGAKDTLRLLSVLLAITIAVGSLDIAQLLIERRADVELQGAGFSPRTIAILHYRPAKAAGSVPSAKALEPLLQQEAVAKHRRGRRSPPCETSIPAFSCAAAVQRRA
jgi:hypothetical protein